MACKYSFLVEIPILLEKPSWELLQNNRRAANLSKRDADVYAAHAISNLNLSSGIIE